MSLPRKIGPLRRNFVMFSRCVVALIISTSLPTDFFVQIFKDATLFFSRGTPNIATVIPAMDHIDEHLATAALSSVYPLAIKAALAIGKRTLNRYYDKTDHSEVFRIAMGQSLKTMISSLPHKSLSQFSILDTSSTTSRKPDGRRIGLRGQRNLFEQNSSGHISPWEFQRTLR